MELFIPSTYGIDERDDRLKVQRFGDLARAASIFGADQITIYKDQDPKSKNEKKNATLLEKYLAYAECPPYLRKQLIPHDPDLQYASIMPPLQTLSHGYSETFREAAVTESGSGYSIIDAGLDDPVEITEDLPEGMRLTLRKTDRGWTIVDPDSIEGYWTFTLRNVRQPLGEVLPKGMPIIGTSAHGQSYRKLPGDITEFDYGIVFGSAWRGVYELIERGDVNENQFHGIYDFVEDQHTRTVRTTEAIFIVLSVMNAL